MSHGSTSTGPGLPRCVTDRHHETELIMVLTAQTSISSAASSRAVCRSRAVCHAPYVVERAQHAAAAPLQSRSSQAVAGSLHLREAIAWPSGAVNSVQVLPAARRVLEVVVPLVYRPAMKAAFLDLGTAGITAKVRNGVSTDGPNMRRVCSL